MKRGVIAVSVLAASIAMTACTSKKTETEPATSAVSAAITETAGTAADETSDSTAEAAGNGDGETTESGEIVTEDFASGPIIKLEGNILTIMDDFEDIERKFDLSSASIVKSFPLTVGDYVEIAFPEGQESTVTKAFRLEVLDSVMAEDADPLMIGTIQEVNDITILVKADDGEVYNFVTENAYVVTGPGKLASGKEAQITYLGELGEDDDLMAIKVVTEDAYDTAAAKLNIFIGEVDSVYDGGIVLVSVFDDYLTFISSKLNFEAFEEGSTVRVTFEGSISAKEIPAVAIETN